MKEIIVIIICFNNQLLLWSHIEVIRIVHVPLFIDSQVRSEINVYFVLIGIFCCNNNNTIGGPGSINGCGGSVFQHIDSGNIIRIDVFDISFHRQTVDHQKRGRFCIQRACTTDS